MCARPGTSVFMFYSFAFTRWHCWSRRSRSPIACIVCRIWLYQAWRCGNCSRTVSVHTKTYEQSTWLEHLTKALDCLSQPSAPLTSTWSWSNVIIYESLFYDNVCAVFLNRRLFQQSVSSRWPQVSPVFHKSSYENIRRLLERVYFCRLVALPGAKQRCQNILVNYRPTLIHALERWSFEPS